jgi:copper(I)-binding protein
MGVLLLSPVALSACSAGQVTQTATQERDKVGALAAVGDITLRKANLEHPGDGGYAAGDDAVLVLAIANGSDEADTLTDISGEGFDEAVISTSGAAAPSTSSVPGASTAPADPTTDADAAATPPVATQTAPPAAATTELEIPARSTVFIGEESGPTVTLSGLDEALTTGRYLELTFTFENAGEVTMLVPVANPAEVLERGEAFDFHHEEEASGGETGGEHSSEESEEGAQREGGE